MKLSVVIVNYNVEHFLEQCLSSVFKALKGLDGEVFVVDNNSVDGSVRMVKQRFPECILIESNFNAGFSKANNMAIERSKGEYVLLLNPDTVVEEDTLRKVVDFMDAHPDAGGLGVKMVDGKGRFLPESKRGLPTPWVAFYKIFGLSALFPRSRRFGRYHLGYLDKHQVHSVEVLSGAFMLMRRSALNKTGLLDETFFMYGEDIDLSYRIIKAGYKNYYFPETTIIHYKGESTRKSSVNYVFVFYRAMVIFAKKHFSEQHARTFSVLINMAIWLRASLALAERFVKRSALFVLDMAAISGVLFGITRLYEQEAGKQFPDKLLYVALPVYAVAWVITSLYSGAYDKPVRWYNLLKGTILGTLLILAGYAMLDKEQQFSRIVILLGMAGVFGYYVLSRLLFRYTGPLNHSLSGAYSRRFAIVGLPNEAARVNELLHQSLPSISSVDLIYPENQSPRPEHYAGNLGQLHEVVQLRKINEIIFCAKDLSVQEIIQVMSAIGKEDIDFKIAQPDTLFLIGSNSIHRSGDLYMLEVNGINTPFNRRLKRLIDLAACLMVLVMLPVLLFLNHPGNLLRNWVLVLSGSRSWVGYGSKGLLKGVLPPIKKGVLSPSAGQPDADESLRLKLDQIYARSYHPVNDVRLISAGIRQLGSKS